MYVALFYSLQNQGLTFTFMSVVWCVCEPAHGLCFVCVREYHRIRIIADLVRPCDDLKVAVEFMLSVSVGVLRIKCGIVFEHLFSGYPGFRESGSSQVNICVVWRGACGYRENAPRVMLNPKSILNPNPQTLNLNPTSHGRAVMRCGTYTSSS